MIHILKSKSGYRVRYTGRNGEILATSEVLTSKQNAWKNVRAMCVLFSVGIAFVTDENKKAWSLAFNEPTGKYIKDRVTITNPIK